MFLRNTETLPNECSAVGCVVGCAVGSAIGLDVFTEQLTAIVENSCAPASVSSATALLVSQ